MEDTRQPVEIPNRSLFKAAEVCDLAKLQPYVLRSWEAEFKNLGVARSGSSSRVYRREDVERVLRIKHLLLIEGLTLAGVRRKLEEEEEPPLDEAVLLPPPPSRSSLPDQTKARIRQVRQDLRSLLTLLDSPVSAPTPSTALADSSDFSLEPTPPIADSDGSAPVAIARARRRSVSRTRRST
jgi:DNA-binding transcriptional MerR regulator